MKIPLGDACRHSLGFSETQGSAHALVKHLLGAEALSRVAVSTGFPRFVISRWRSGKSERSLEQMLRLLDASVFSLPEFLGRLVAPDLLPSIFKQLEKERRERELHYEHPWIAALLLILRTVEYARLGRHQEGFLAKKLGISLETERAVMKELIEFGVIVKEGARFAPSQRKLCTIGDSEGARRIREYWTARCLGFIRENPPNPPRNHWGYLLFNVNIETARKVRERYFSFFNDLTVIIQQSGEGSEEVYLLNLQLLNIKDLPEK